MREMPFSDLPNMAQLPETGGASEVSVRSVSSSAKLANPYQFCGDAIESNCKPAKAQCALPETNTPASPGRASHRIRQAGATISRCVHCQPWPPKHQSRISAPTRPERSPIRPRRRARTGSYVRTDPGTCPDWRAATRCWNEISGVSKPCRSGVICSAEPRHAVTGGADRGISTDPERPRCLTRWPTYQLAVAPHRIRMAAQRERSDPNRLASCAQHASSKALGRRARFPPPRPRPRPIISRVARPLL